MGNLDRGNAFSVRCVRCGDDLVVRVAVDPSPAPPSRNGKRTSRSPLTELETTVLLRIAQGLTDGEIASCLAVPVNRVKHAIRQTLTKLHCRNRTEAVVTAAASGYIELPFRRRWFDE